MKKQNCQLPENRIFEVMNIHRKIGKGLVEIPEINKTKDLHHINLPNDRSLEVWYDDSIRPIGLNEYQEKTLNQANRRYNYYHANVLETEPFSEIYNMVVMRDSY